MGNAIAWVLIEVDPLDLKGQALVRVVVLFLVLDGCCLTPRSGTMSRCRRAGVHKEVSIREESINQTWRLTGSSASIGAAVSNWLTSVWAIWRDFNGRNRRYFGLESESANDGGW